MYSEIKRLLQNGFSDRKTATILGVSRNTVKKYRELNLDEYMILAHSNRKQSLLDQYKGIILEWLQSYPSMSSAQVFDWILEHYDLDISERSVRRYVSSLRGEYNIPRVATPREYEAVEELPMGYQMQLDFGVKNMALSDRKGSRKVYFVGIVLAHSRYKWGYFQIRPFTTGDLIYALNRCFQYFGGTAHEIVIDQDSIIVVSENQGDIIYTHEFEQYKGRLGLNIRVCRKADPESKGMVESTVKFIKGNFLPHRYFMEEDLLNQAFLAWLDRTGNAKKHGTTKKVPAQVFEFEREHLRAVQSGQNNLTPSIMRMVRKDNTVLYRSNRYSLPPGTYTRHRQVSLVIEDECMQIYDEFGDRQITEHTISLRQGVLIKLTEHSRDRTASLNALEAEVLESVKGSCKNEWKHFLGSIREKMPRYYRDQLTLLKHLIRDCPAQMLEEAMLYCSSQDLYSINDLKSASNIDQDELDEVTAMPEIRLLKDPGILQLYTEKRDLAEYELLGGGGHE